MPENRTRVYYAVRLSQGHSDLPTAAYVHLEDAQKQIDGQAPGGEWKSEHGHGEVWTYYYGGTWLGYVIPLDLY
jgi:hypothetical protein